VKDKIKKKKGLIFVISGPSGSGKTTLLSKVLLSKLLTSRFAKSVSVTTRPKRSGERDKKDYFFVSPAEFKRLNSAKKILEWTRYLGYYYGTKKDFVEAKLKQGKHIALCLDLKGALRVKKLYPGNTVTIFILPPSIKILRKRMLGRCSKTKQEEVLSRLRLAKQELKDSGRYDHVLKNVRLDTAVDKLKKIILNEIK
jgi:guanylate kinase